MNAVTEFTKQIFTNKRDVDICAIFGVPADCVCNPQKFL